MTSISIIKAANSATAIVDRGSLTRALESINRVVEKRNSIPVLGNVRLFASSPSTLTAWATDEDIEIEVVVTADAIDARFDVTVPAKKLGELTKKARASSHVTLNAPISTLTAADLEEPRTDRTAVVSADFAGVEYKLDGLVSACIPTIKRADDTASFRMSGSTLWSAFDAVRGAVSSEETRYYLNGVFVHEVDDEITFVATDGHRMYRQRFDAPEGCAGMPGVIVPRKTVDLFLKLTSAKLCPSIVRVGASAAGISLAFGSTTIRSKVIDGTFPDYQRVIPRDNSNVVTLGSVELAEAVRSVSLISDGSGRGVRLNVSDDGLRCSVNDPSSGSATTLIECGRAGDDVEIGLNIRYLLDVIDRTCPAEEKITVLIGDAGSPVVFSGSSPRFVAVMMPMRV